MYKEFYKLRRFPFQITPDPSFLFLSENHKEALAALYYGAQERKGFVVLTGDVGTGKTLLVRCLLQLLQRTDVAYAYVFNSRLGPLGFLRYVASDLGLSSSTKTKGEVLRELAKYLIDRYQKNQSTLIIVDEAHHLTTAVLEEIRLLTNLETAEEKLVQILLVGQSELSDKLDTVELRQLKQRIALRAYLQPMSKEDTVRYIRRRLELAGKLEEARDIFSQEAVARVYRHSHGVPRLINTVCDNALITAFARQVERVSAEIVDEVAQDLRIDMIVHPRLESGSQGEDVQKAVQVLLKAYREVREVTLDVSSTQLVS